MDRVLAVDAEAGTIRVQAGIRLRNLMRILGALGLSLPVRGSIAEQSIAGATATGTHGSSPEQGGLSTLITAVRLVTPDGTVHHLSDADPRTRDLFDAARVGLGALGVITEVTLRVVPDFVLREEVQAVTVDAAVRSFDQIRTSAPFVKLWLVPHTDKALIFRYWPTDEEPNLSAAAAWVDEHIVNPYLLRALIATTRRSDRAAPPQDRPGPRGARPGRAAGPRRDRVRAAHRNRRGGVRSPRGSGPRRRAPDRIHPGGPLRGGRRDLAVTGLPARHLLAGRLRAGHRQRRRLHPGR